MYGYFTRTCTYILAQLITVEGSVDTKMKRRRKVTREQNKMKYGKWILSKAATLLKVSRSLASLSP